MRLIQLSKNTKHKKILTQNILETQDKMERPNLKIIGIKENEDSQLKGPENTFNKITEENIPNLKKKKAIKVQKPMEH